MLFLAGVIIIILVVFAAAIKFSEPVSPPPLTFVGASFQTMDYSQLPPLSYYAARDGIKLAYRSYPSTSPSAKTVVLIHGSSGSGMEMHALAKFMQGQGINVYVPDMRGHGESGKKGDIAYIGQMEDDIEDLIHEVLKDRADLTLVGFSSGGGFALRFAASDKQNYFDRYILLAPFMSHDAPTTKPENSKWASASVPRIIGISLLGSIGEKYFGHLPVLAFGVNPQNAQNQTPVYSYRLWKNFGAHHDYKLDMKNAQKPIAVLVGKDDEFMYPQEYLPLFAKWQPHAEINIVPDVGHITLITDEAGLSAIAEQISH
jgi:alpha-beta hydrolase superfamily lysophospholipase